jgi:Bacterial SH3 domain
MVPREDGVILGGISELDNNSETADEQADARIIAAHRVVFAAMRRDSGPPDAILRLGVDSQLPMRETIIRSQALRALSRAAVFAAAGLCALVAFAAVVEGTVTRDDVIRAEPAAAGARVAGIKAGTTVKVAERSGFWRRVESTAGNGWLKLSSVRVDSGDSSGAGLAALATGRGATGNVVTTSGTRGVSAHDLTGAAPDAAELQRVEAMGVTGEQASAFATDAGLTPRSLDYLAPHGGEQRASAAGRQGDR